MVLRTITGARTPVCLLTAIISVEAVTPPEWLAANATVCVNAAHSARFRQNARCAPEARQRLKPLSKIRFQI
jgi:hypothetical protein